MAGSSQRSPVPAYLAMAAAVLAVVVALNMLSSSAPRQERATERENALPPQPNLAIIGGFGSTIERDFLPTILRRPRVSERHRYCDASGCCPTSRTTLGTTTDAHLVVATLRSQGFLSGEGDPTIVRAGPSPRAGWTGVSGDGTRETWRRVDVSHGVDVGRPAWPTVFVLSLAVCDGR
ncbi:MAG TPA: hypothetical protein VIC52_01050 [Actinomycetota bacterium]|jgi:hypothetical protein